MKKFYTVQEVEAAISRGEKEIMIEHQDIVTSEARDFAQRKGVSFKNRQDMKKNPVVMAEDSSILTQNRFIKTVNYNKLMSNADVDQWREEFPILKNIIHVANCSQSAQSKRVRRAINDYLENWLTVGMDWQYWCDEVIKAKEEFAKMINADVEEIAVSTSVSEIVSSIASSLDYTGARKKIVTTEAEFPTVAHVWLAHQKYGAKVEFVPVENGEIDIEQYEKYIDHNTLMTSITHVYYENGFKQDIETITDIAHSKGSLVLVDAYQSLGTTPIDVKKMNIDILTSGNLKYLFGIPGIAFVYVNKDLIPKLKPAVTGWFGQENPFAFHVRYIDYASSARRFETGTPPVLTSFAAREGMKIINEVGVLAISDRMNLLSERAIKGCLDRGLDLVSPIDIRKKGGTTAIRLTIDSHYVEAELAKRKIIASARGDVIRVAPHFYTKPEEIDYVLDQIKDIIRK